MQYDAFISYRRDHGSVMARLIHLELHMRGLRSFFDWEELRSGRFNEKIYDAIRDCKNFILVLPPHALDRCADEEDWVRKEIVAAVDAGKNIVPIMCDGFEWPKTWAEGVPSQIREMSLVNAVKPSEEYHSAFIDKIISFMDGIPEVLLSEQEAPVTTSAYFEVHLNDPTGVRSVDLAFHGGNKWLTDETLTELLNRVLDAAIPIRVLINSPVAAEIIAKHMRQRRRGYTGFRECICKWEQYQREESDGLVTVRVCDIPLLRIYHRFHMTDSDKDTVNVRHYTYANAKMDQNYRSIFHRGSPYFDLYQNEFEYLWERSIPVTAAL